MAHSKQFIFKLLHLPEAVKKLDRNMAKDIFSVFQNGVQGFPICGKF